MKKTAFTLLAGLALLCSCEKNLSDDGMAMRFDVVPGTSIKESQLGSKKYTEAENHFSLPFLITQTMKRIAK